MKKLFEKITSIALAIISILFIALIIAFMFKPELATQLKTDLVRVFIIVLSSSFLVLTGLNIYASFADNERLSNVLLFKDKESATKATVGVVKRTAKRVTKNMEDAKIKKVTLFTDSSGNITMNIEIKLNTDDTMSVITKIRALIIETFKEIFKIEFAAINFRIIKSKNTFVPKEEDVNARVEELKSQIVSNKPDGNVQTSTVTGDIVKPAVEEDETIAATEESTEEAETIAATEESTEEAETIAATEESTEEAETIVATEESTEEAETEVATEESTPEDVASDEPSTEEIETITATEAVEIVEGKATEETLEAEEAVLETDTTSADVDTDTKEK